MTVDTLVPLGLILAAASVVAGILAGLLGVGGGIVIVPILYWILSGMGFDYAVVMHVAVATSLLTIIPTSISSSRSHMRRGNIDSELLRRWIPGVFLGALMGGIASRYLGGPVLSGVFGVVGLLVAVNMAIPRTLRLADKLPVSSLWNSLVSGVVGFVSALMGIGGGTFSVPILGAYGYPILKAVGTASALGFVIAVPAVLGFVWSGWDVSGRPPFSFGYANVAAALIITPITVLTAPLGARIASAINQRALKLCFAVFLAITALRMLWTALGL